MTRSSALPSRSSKPALALALGLGCAVLLLTGCDEGRDSNNPFMGPSFTAGHTLYRSGTMDHPQATLSNPTPITGRPLK